MASAVIQCEGVSKLYRLGEYGAGGMVREAIVQWFRRRGRPPKVDETWALHDVSFELPEGGALGVVGRNGAGKSTLLKILARIVEPTEGVSRTRGRVASLLEAGTGFHSELTGKENVFLNGAVMGMTRRDVRRRYDEIVEFAGLERFMDTPVKRYSTGMYLRLAFSIAAHLEPDILLVDEVLAVGDAEFQRRCLGRVAEAEREGRTLLFVSHDLEAVRRVCPRAIWLDRGRIRSEGACHDVVVDYFRAEAADEHFLDDLDDPSLVVVIRKVTFTDLAGDPVDVVLTGQPFAIEVHCTLRERYRGFDLAVRVVNERGVRVLDEVWSDSAAVRPSDAGDYVVRVELPPVLAAGEYAIGVWAGSAYETQVDKDAARVLRIEGSRTSGRDRLVALGAPWSFRSGGPDEQDRPRLERHG